MFHRRPSKAGHASGRPDRTADHESAQGLPSKADFQEGSPNLVGLFAVQVSKSLEKHVCHRLYPNIANRQESLTWRSHSQQKARKKPLNLDPLASRTELGG